MDSEGGQGPRSGGSGGSGRPASWSRDAAGRAASVADRPPSGEAGAMDAAPDDGAPTASTGTSEPGSAGGPNGSGAGTLSEQDVPGDASGPAAGGDAGPAAAPGTPGSPAEPSGSAGTRGPEPDAPGGALPWTPASTETPGDASGGPAAAPGPDAHPTAVGGPSPWGGPAAPADPWAAPAGPGTPPRWADPGGRAGPPPYAGPGVPAGGPAPWNGAPRIGDPGMPPPWGGPPPYGFDAPPPRRTNSGLVAALVGGGVLVVILLVLGVATLSGSGDDPTKVSGKAASQAGTALGAAPGLALDGTYAGGRATFDVTRAGSACGSYTSGGAQIGRVDIAGGTYLKAASAFWTAKGVSSARAAKANDKWTKAPDFTVELNLSDLSPARLAQVLQVAGNDPVAKNTTVRGVKAIKMTAGGRTYYIAAKGARRLLRVEGATDAGRFSFDVTPLTSSGMGAVFTTLRTDVQGLLHAYDPAVSVLPVGKLRFGDCTQPGCTVSVDVRPSTDDDTAATVRVSMNVTFRGSRGTVSTCSDSASARTGHQRTLSCRTQGHAWSSWYGAQTGRFTIHAGAVFSASVNSASDVATLLGRLSQEQRGD